MLRSRTVWAAAALALLWLATAARAGEEPSPPLIRVAGEATLTAPPDRARIEVRVVTQARTADAAARENAAKLEAVLEAVRKGAGRGATIGTTGYTLHPDHRYPREGGRPEIVGYTASNGVSVETGDLDRMGRVIDAATGAGANQIGNVEFRLSDDGKIRAEALRQASRQARDKGMAIAEALDLHVVGVRSVEESDAGVVVPFRQEAAVLRAGAAPTPIEPGPIEVRARVTLTLEVSGPQG